MRTCDKAKHQLINAEFEAVQFDVTEAVALLNRAVENLNKLQGKPIPPVEEVPVKKRRPISPNAV